MGQWQKNAGLSPHARGYGSRWKRIRAQVLRSEPLCRACLNRNRVIPATTVDHILPKARGGTDALENLQPLCDDCHKAKTAAESSGGTWSGENPRDRGCTADGIPISASHHWNR